MADAKQGKLLAEWFWTDRWIGSSAFLLPLEPRGLYREMLTQAWRRGCRLPSNHEAIQRAVGCTAAEWRRNWPLIEKYWRVDGDSYVNDTQLEVWTETKAIQERASERGRKGAQARARAHAQAPTQATAQAQSLQVLQSQPPSPSLSPDEDLPQENAGDLRSRARGFSPGPLAGMLPRDHLNCRPPCVRVCLSERQFAVFVQQHGGERDVAERAVDEWAIGIRASLPPGAIGDRPWKFWESHWAASHPNVAPTEVRHVRAAAGSGRTGSANAALYDVGRGRDGDSE